MSLKMFAEYKILKKEQRTGKYKYLTAADMDDLPFPGGFGFTINGDDIPFDFHETTTSIYGDDTFVTIMGSGEFIEGDLTADYDETYAEMGLARKDLTPEFLASVSQIYEFFLNLEDSYGDEYDAGTFEENINGKSMFKVELLSISFIDEREIECAVAQYVLNHFNGKLV